MPVITTAQLVGDSGERIMRIGLSGYAPEHLISVFDRPARHGFPFTPAAARQNGRSGLARPSRRRRTENVKEAAAVAQLFAALAVAPAAATSCRPSANSSTIFEQKACRSSGLRLETRP